MNEFFQTVSDLVPGLLAMFALIMASGFFSSSETALFYLSHDDVRNMRIGKPSEQAVAELLSDPNRLLTAVLFWNLVINLLYFATSVAIAQGLFESGKQAAAGVFSFLGLLVIIVFGEVVPKSVAVVFPRQISCWLIWPLSIAIRLVDSVTPFLTQVSRIGRRTFFAHIKHEPRLAATDLEKAIQVTPASKNFIRHERQVLHNVLELSEIPVEEVMRPRGTYSTFSPPIALADLEQKVPQSNYVIVKPKGHVEIQAAVPITELTQVPSKDLESAAADVVHVPWCATLAYTLQLLRDSYSSVASVVNEHGDTIGIVTYDDIVDTILLPQPSRAKRLLKREPVLEVAPGHFHVDGLTTLRYLCKKLGIDYDSSGEGLVTLTGLLHEELEHIPQMGDEVVWRGLKIKIINVNERGQLRAMIMRNNVEA